MQAQVAWLDDKHAVVVNGKHVMLGRGKKLMRIAQLHPDGDGRRIEWYTPEGERLPSQHIGPMVAAWKALQA